MAKHKSSSSQRRSIQKSNLLFKVIGLLLLCVIAGAFFLITGDVPEEVQQMFPQELRDLLLPPTPTPFPPTPIPETPQPDIPASGTPQPGTPAMNLSKIAGNAFNDSFNKSKRLLMEMHVEAGQFITFYCGSRFDADNKVYHDESGFHFRKDEARSNRLEWEHVVPAEAFGNSFVEWREGHPDCVDSKGKSFKGRDCAEKTNMAYRYMQADLFNLQPAIGEVNGRRNNYSFTMLDGEEREFGTCNMEIRDSKAEPPDNRFGDIARTYMYMESAYPGHGIISNQDEKMFAAWNNMDPVDAWECERARLIAEIQGNRNVIVEEACAAAGL